MTKLSMRTTSNEDAAALYSMTSLDEIEDRLHAMQAQETSASYCPVDYSSLDYMMGVDGDTTIENIAGLSTGNASRRGPQQGNYDHQEARRKMATWCFELADITFLSRLAVSRSMTYLDRYTATRPSSLINNDREYQLAAMTSMYIAVKLHEPLSMDAALLAEISAGCYTATEILDMEKCILDALQWRMNGPASQEYVCLLLGLLNPEGYGYELDTLGSLLDVCKFQCELATADYELSLYRPSHVALAAILNSLDGMMVDQQISDTEQYSFLRRMCRMMSQGGDVDMIQIGLVRDRLRGLFCQNLGVAVVVSDEDREDEDDDFQGVEESSQEDNTNDTSAVVKRRRSFMDQRQKAAGSSSCKSKCPSPVSVA